MLELIHVAHAATEAVTEVADTGVAAKFGLNLKLLIAQLVNFSIVFFVLWRWVLKPLMASMNKRQEIIEKGLADAAASRESLARAESDYGKKMMEAKQATADILKDAEKRANEATHLAKEKAKEEIVKTVNQAKVAIQSERDQVLKEVKAASAHMIVNATEKILQEKLTDAKDKKLVERLVQEIS